MSLTPIQRRKAHIICAFQRLEHVSVGGIGDRRVIAYFKQKKDEKDEKDDEKTDNPLAASAAEAAKVPDTEPTLKPDWMDLPEDEIYEWCWKTVAATGVGSQMLKLHNNSTDEKVRLQAVDILLKLCEHNLQKEENEEHILRDFLMALLSNDETFQLVGAHGLNILISKRHFDRFVRVEDTSVEREEGKGPAMRLKFARKDTNETPLDLFRWAGKTVMICMKWYQDSDGEPDFISGDAGFAF
eukprot:SAG11_NODE_6660_length_1271_cov_2.051195_2_plen_242_part_00